MMAREKPDYSSWKYAGLGMELAAAIAGFALLGWWIDHKFGTGPWGLVICAILGMVGGFYNMIRQSLWAFKESEADESKRRNR